MGQVPQGIVSVPDSGGKPETLIAASRTSPGRTAAAAKWRNTLHRRAFTGDLEALGYFTNRRAKSKNGRAEGMFKPEVELDVSTGHLVTVSATVYAVPFDPRSSRYWRTGTVIEGVRRSQLATTGAAFFSLSDDGSLAYIPGGTTADLPRVLALADRSGGTRVLPLSPAGYDVPRFSPDGKHIAVGIRDAREFNIWIYDLEGSTSIRRLTFGGRNQVPAWTTDGKRIVFRSDRDGEACLGQAADGSSVAERLTPRKNRTTPRMDS